MKTTMMQDDEQLCWVYIIEDGRRHITIGISEDIESKIRRLINGEKLTYLRHFLQPFDALAHKHLLEDLSAESVRALTKAFHKHRGIDFHNALENLK